MVIGQIVLISLVLMVRGPRAVTVPLVLLKASVAAYLIKSSPTLANALHFAEAPLIVMAMAAPYLVWVCANVLFDFEKPPIWVMVALPSVTVVMCGYDILHANTPAVVRILSISASLAAILHAVYSVVRGSLDDLSEPRRRFRLCFVACISLVSVLVLVLELAFIGKEDPAWLPITNVSLIAAVLLVISVPLLTSPGDLLPHDPHPPQGNRTRLDVADQETHNALVTAMKNRAYARTGLTIRQLAEELKTPEHQLRSLINSRMGYKNFSTFLNSYRIEETCERLLNPKEVRLPILTIALDAGFASLAPFNRAFRTATSMTPSEFRNKNLKPTQVVTSIHR